MKVQIECLAENHPKNFRELSGMEVEVDVAQVNSKPQAAIS